MNGFDELASMLSQEVLTEMAENFFGTRSRLDALLDGFQNLVRQFRQIQTQTQARFSVLHFLLLRGAEAENFYRALGADPGLVSFAPPELVLPSSGPAFGLTRKGRYAKTVQAAYAEAATEAHGYMHGHSYVDHKDRGRRKLSIHYKQLQELCSQINASVHKVNENLSPSGVMQYMKTFNPENVSRENIAGASDNGYAESLDKSMRFQPVDFAGLGLRELPELPPAKEAEAPIHEFCGRLAGERPAEVDDLLRDLDAAYDAVRRTRGK
ncbi:MAG TPA: hypothetical protein DDW80_03960 [Desulfovibrio sp.]|nr:hypothetical protein [Desulfovibrio sp.]